jgi:acyl transferase domain-containing protein
VRALAARYLAWLDEQEELGTDNAGPLLADMAWTAGVGRSHFAHRAAVLQALIAPDMDELVERAAFGDHRHRQRRTDLARVRAGGAVLQETRLRSLRAVPRCDSGYRV